MTADRVFRFFNVKKTEEKLILFLVGYSFCMGGAMAVYYAVVVSDFLTTFGPSAIPGSYILGGLLVYFLGWLIQWAGQQYTFKRQSEQQLRLLVISIGVLTIAYHVTRLPWIIFALFIWNRVFVLIHGVTFWAAVARIFDLQQSKRLYSLINSGEVAASIIAYFSVPILLQFVSADLLLYSVILLLTFCCVIQYVVHKRFLAHDPVGSVASAPDMSAPVDDAPRKPYYRSLFLLAMFGVLGLLYTDYLFFTESRRAFPDRELLAGFLGIFFGICAVFEVVIKAFFYHKLTSRYGLKAMITALPVLLLFSLILALVYGYGFEADTIVFFAFIVLARLFMSSIRKSVSDPAFQVLYQAIPAQMRLAVQRNIEGRGKSLGGLIAGGLLWVLLLIPGISNRDLVLVFVPLVVLWLIFSLRGQRLYRQSILTRLLEPQFYKVPALFQKLTPRGQTSIPVPDAEILARKNKAVSLKQSGAYSASLELIPLLQDASPMVRKAALDSAGRLAALRPQIVPYLFEQLHDERFSEEAKRAMLANGPSVRKTVIRRLAAGTDNEQIQLKLIDLIATSPDAGTIKILRAQLTSPSRNIAERSLIGLLVAGYKPNLSESSRLLLLLEEHFAFYTWLLALYDDLSQKFSDAHTLMRALTTEREKLTLHIFSILGFLYHQRFFLLITQLIRERENDLRGLLVEISDIELKGNLKVKIKTILETDFTQELLQTFETFYPQIHSTPEERLYELINQDFTRLSLWTKALAIKELHHYPRSAFSDIFPAYAVSPYKILAQTALFGLRATNTARYEQLRLRFNSEADPTHRSILNELETMETDDQLMVCRVSRLRFLSVLRNAEDTVIRTIMRFGLYGQVTNQEKIPAEPLIRDDQHLILIVTYGEIVLDGEIRADAGIHHFSATASTLLFAEPLTEYYVIPAYLLPDLNEITNSHGQTLKPALP